MCNVTTQFNHSGCSLGGLLACAVAADVWSSAYIRTDILQNSLVCVTFGQPHISLPGVLQAAREPELASAIHTLHLYDDVFPRVLPLLNECCNELGPKEETATITLKAPSMTKMVHKTSYLCLYKMTSQCCNICVCYSHSKTHVPWKCWIFFARY